MHFHTSLNRTGLKDLLFYFFFAVVIKSVSENKHKEEQANGAGVVKQSACKPAGWTLPGRQLAWWAGGEAWALTLITSWPWANASCHKLDVLRSGQPSGQPCRHPWAHWTKLYRTYLLANSYKLPEHKVSSSNCLIFFPLPTHQNSDIFCPFWPDWCNMRQKLWTLSVEIRFMDVSSK